MYCYRYCYRYGYNNTYSNSYGFDSLPPRFCRSRVGFALPPIYPLNRFLMGGMPVDVGLRVPGLPTNPLDVPCPYLALPCYIKRSVKANETALQWSVF